MRINTLLGDESEGKRLKFAETRERPNASRMHRYKRESHFLMTERNPIINTSRPTRTPQSSIAFVYLLS